MKQIIQFLLNKLSLLIKTKDYILFESQPEFSDNSEALYARMLELDKNKQYKYIWLVEDLKEHEPKSGNEQLKLIGKSKTNFISILKQFYYISSSRYAFYSHGRPLIRPKRNQVFVNLWHGCGLKKVDFIDFEKNFKYVLTTSELFNKAYNKHFGIPRNKLLSLGNPRTDYLFSTRELPSEIVPSNIESFFIWMPTFRVNKNNKREDFVNIVNHEVDLPIVNSYQKLSSLNKVLKKHNKNLIIKPHPAHDLEKLNLKELDKIVVLNNNQLKNNGVKLYELVGRADYLITDFSSIYVDYLLIDKPMIFTVDDLYDYKTGFTLNPPLKFMPGIKVTDFDSFVTNIEELCIGADKYQLERKKINRLLNGDLGKNVSDKIIVHFNILDIKPKKKEEKK